MSKPIIAAVSPKKVTLEQGQEYYFVPVGVLKTSHFVTAHMPEPISNPKHLQQKSRAMPIYANVSTLPMRHFVMVVTNNLIKA
tara:strand:+ start:34410 stop:34658 length:249 start_codon:yes stop_codon:yes gene_type:complete